MYKNLIDLFKENEGKGAVGAFNLHCFEMLPSMIHAAEELDVPIIIQTSLGTAEYIGFEPLIAAVKALAEKSSVSVCVCTALPSSGRVYSTLPATHCTASDCTISGPCGVFSSFGKVCRQELCPVA